MKIIETFEGERAARYDQQISVFIPHYPILSSQIVAVMRAYFSSSDAINILVAGCGTGTEMRALLTASAHWHCTGADPSPEMIAQARHKLKEFPSSQYTLQESTADQLPNTPEFDAATLVLVMHFLTDDGAKLQLLRSISQRLKPGSPLVLVDMFKEPETFERHVAVLQAYVSQFDIPPERLEQAFHHIRHEIQAVPEQRLRDLLQEAGFHNTFRFNQHLMFGGWVAEKMGALKK